MKKLICKTGLIFAAVLLTSGIAVQAQELSKEFLKSFPVKPSTEIHINNRYGDVVFETWDRDEVSVKVKVVADLRTAERSERLLSMIDIEFTETEKSVGARTLFDDRFSSATNVQGDSSFKIDYTVRMPRGNDIVVVNKYGNIKMGQMDGRIDVDLRYGNLIAIRLSRGNVKPINNIVVYYGIVSIDEANWISVISRYVSDMNINKVQAMTLNSRYAKIVVGQAGSIVTESKYDNITVGEINNMVSKASYSVCKLGTLGGILKLNLQYGSFEASGIAAGFESVSVNSSYTNIRLGIDENAAYSLDARVNYGSLIYCEDCLDIINRKWDGNTREISALTRRAASDTASVFVRSSYGSVKLR